MKKILLIMVLFMPVSLLAEKKVIDYKICSGWNSDEEVGTKYGMQTSVVKCVKEYLAKDWELYGTPYAPGNGTYQNQALVKYSD